jgi:ribonuclease I
MILEQELRELGWQFWVWLCSPFSFSLWFATHSKLSSTVQLPGTSLASVEVSLTDLKNWLQKTNKQTNKTTAVFIELLPQLKIVYKLNFGLRWP